MVLIPPPKLLLQSWLEPLVLLSYSILAILTTILTLLVSSPTQLLHIHQWRNKAFALFWEKLNPPCAPGTEPEVDPVFRALFAENVSGIVVDLGPGSGVQCHLYALVTDQVKHVYFIEPNVELQTSLVHAAEKAGLAGRYTILTAGAEDVLTALSRHGLQPGHVDTILSIKCLCSVPHVPTKAAPALYKLLKGNGQGRLLFWEHIRNREFFPTTVYQWCLDWVWPTLLSGCHLSRDTDKVLREAGQWDTVTLKRSESYLWFAPIQFLFGLMVKA
jgi:hypothetical protein